MSDLDALRSAVRGYLSSTNPQWGRLTGELGLMSLPSEQADLSLICAVLEETGRVLLRAPYLSCVVAATALEALGESTFRSGLADGSVTACLALDGSLEQVADAVGATILLLGRGDDLVLVDDFTAAPLEPLDPTRPRAHVVAGAGRVIGSADHARELLHLALAAESVGAAQRLLELTVEHLLTREQFGRPLGSFQALRHRIADLTVLVEAATSTIWYAAQPDSDLAVNAPLAKAVASDAFVTVAGECLQLHGGIGFTWEHDLHLYFKRAWTTALLHGDNASLRRLAFERAGR